MSAASQIDVEAEAVRRSIAQGVQTGSSALAEFSSRYALSPEYKNAALAMRVTIPTIEDPETAAGLRGRMTDILDGILAERAREDPDVSRELQARKLLFAQFRKEGSKSETICRADNVEKRFAGFELGPISFELQ